MAARRKAAGRHRLGFIGFELVQHPLTVGIERHQLAQAEQDFTSASSNVEKIEAKLGKLAASKDPDAAKVEKLRKEHREAVALKRVAALGALTTATIDDAAVCWVALSSARRRRWLQRA